MARNKINIEHLAAKDIEELSKKRNGGEVFLSLYVGIKPGRNFVSEVNSVISEELRKIKKRNEYAGNVLQKIEKITWRIKEKIRLLKIPRETRSIALFCGAKNFGKFYHVPSYIPSMFVAGSDFYIHPFIKAVEDHPKYLVAVFERDKARFFSFFLGEVEEISNIISSEVPQRINAARAEWKGLRETKVQHHIRDHENRHIKKVSDEVENYFRFKKNGFAALIVGAHREFTERFVSALCEKSKKKLIGSYSIMPNYRIDEIKKKSQNVVEDHERMLEFELAGKILNSSGKKKGFAVLGINLALENFYLHNIKMFVIGRDYKEPGFLCPKCHYISSYEKICPRSKVRMIKIDDIADEIIEEAIANRIKIKHFAYSSKEFDRFGIGAILKTSL